MIDFFYDAMLRYRLKKRFKILNSQTKEPIKSFKSLVVILPYERGNDYDFCNALAKEFKISIHKITLVVFSKKEIEATTQNSENRIFCSRKDLSFSGSFSDELESLFSHKVDLVINYFTVKSVFLDFLSTSFDTKLRVGFSRANPKLNDVIFNFSPENKKLFLTESSNYLKAFLKK